MSKWATPDDLPSDGVTGPRWARKIMGYKQYEKQGRRHDFECRYSIYHWKSALKYFIKGVIDESRWYQMPRVPVFIVVLVANRERCEWTHPDPLPPEWVSWINRGYSK